MKKKILIVEDEESLRMALADKLISQGYETVRAKNGKEGLEIAFNQKPDLILLDIVMPVMDGITMLYKLRDDERGKSIPVMLLTNLSDPNAIADGVEERADGYFVKSDWKLHDIMEVIDKRLKNA